jgi:hypothetical protein
MEPRDVNGGRPGAPAGREGLWCAGGWAEALACREGGQEAFGHSPAVLRIHPRAPLWPWSATAMPVAETVKPVRVRKTPKVRQAAEPVAVPVALFRAPEAQDVAAQLQPGQSLRHMPEALSGLEGYVTSRPLYVNSETYYGPGPACALPGLPAF